MTLLSEMPMLAQNVFVAFVGVMFFLCVAIFLMVFYITKKQLTERIQQLTHENNRLLARLGEHR